MVVKTSFIYFRYIRLDANGSVVNFCSLWRYFQSCCHISNFYIRRKNRVLNTKSYVFTKISIKHFSIFFQNFCRNIIFLCHCHMALAWVSRGVVVLILQGKPGNWEFLKNIKLKWECWKPNRSKLIIFWFKLGLN